MEHSLQKSIQRAPQKMYAIHLQSKHKKKVGQKKYDMAYIHFDFHRITNKCSEKSDMPF